MKTYSVIMIDGTQYTVPPRLGLIVRGICQDDRLHAMAQIAFDWLQLTVNNKGRSNEIAVSAGSDKTLVDAKAKM
jgi:hypothetical protein